MNPGAVTEASLKNAVSDDRVRQFYEHRNWKPAWTSDTAPGVVQVLRGAGRHGLNPDDYVRPITQAGDPAEREAALTLAVLRLADDLADGKTDPDKLFSIYTLPRPSVDPVEGLSNALSQSRADEWIEGLAPSDPEYQALSKAYLQNAKRAAEGKSKSIAEGDLIHEGERDPRVPQIAQVLRANGYLEGGSRGVRTGDDGAPTYTTRMAQAVKHLQQDFGIADDGVVGPDTLQVLNTGAAERARVLAVNLERRRWLERDRPATRIDVNTAAAMLEYYRDGKRRDRRKVIVGQQGWETPQLAAPMYRLVANPTWTVPRSIEREEIQPKGAGYLQRHNMVRRDGWVVQLPGPDNALGVVKFDLKDDYAIYLHDTAAKQLFDRNQRHLSHGCVRVNHAPEFARMLAKDVGIYSEFSKARAGDDETFVNLPQNIPVRLLYETAFVDPAGKVRFRTDAYGWDDRVAEALGYEPRQPTKVQTHISDIGP